MKSCKLSTYQTHYPSLYNPNETHLKINQIDFNKVLYVINSETQQSFLSSRKKKQFFQTQRNYRNHFTHQKRAQSSQLSSFENQCVASELTRDYLGQLNKTFNQSQKYLRATFPIKIDATKKKIKHKAKLNIQTKISRSFVSSLSQLQTAFSIPIATPKAKSVNKPKTILKFYTIEEIMGKNSKLKKLLIRQIGRFDQEEYKMAQTTLLNTVDEYLKMSVKPMALKKRTNLSSKPVSFHKKRTTRKIQKLDFMQKVQNNY